MKPETAWMIVAGVGGGLAGFGLLPSVTYFILIGALVVWLLTTKRRDRQLRGHETADATVAAQDHPVVISGVDISPTAIRVLAVGILSLAIGVAGHLENVW